jgi:HlyD family secretion protein
MKKRLISSMTLLALAGAVGGGGYLIAMDGQDAVSAAAEEKSGLLVADVVNASFQQVGGRIDSIKITEEQQVKKDTVLMTLDTKDVDLQIQKLQVDLEQMNVKIAQAKDGVNTGATKAAVQEQEALLGIESAEAAESLVNQGTRGEDVKRQGLAVESAQKSISVAEQSVKAAQKSEKIAQQTAKSAEQSVNAALETEKAAQQTAEFVKKSYERLAGLLEAGLISQAEVDKAKNEWNHAQSRLETAKTQVETAKNQAEAAKTQVEAANTQTEAAKKQVEIAQNAAAQQQAVLEKMEAGPTAEEREQARVATEKARVGLTKAQQAQLDVQNNAFNIDLLLKQKESMEVQLESLQVQKERMTLKAPVDGKITRIIPKVGENVGAGSPVVMMETDQLYFELYVDEKQVSKFKAGEQVVSHVVSLNKDVKGTTRFVTSAPQYASIRMSDEKGQSDVSTFLVRIDVKRTSELLPGMTMEVRLGESAKR